MPVHNAEIAELFSRLADLLELEDANPFRVRAYRTAARTINGLSHSLADLLAAGEDLSKLPGIGKDLAGKIRTLIETGRLPLLEQVQARTPAALSELMKIEGLGPKRVKVLYQQLHIGSIEDLQRAARSGRIRTLTGFGAKTEAKILERLERSRQAGIRTRLADAEDIAATLSRYLRNCPGVKQVCVAGSYRRRRDTVGDLDILVTARQGTAVTDYFAAYDEVSEVVSQGKTRATVHLRSGIQVDLRVVPQVSYGAALLYFTGSRAHNIALRKLAIGRGYKLNEYGLYRGDKRVAGATETSVYEKLGLAYIEPELREQHGEIEAARKGRLPRLVCQDDIRGDLHCHTRATDGHDSLEAMVAAARKLGYEYLAITDHSKRVSVAHGLDRKRLLDEIRRIDKLNARLDDIVVLKSIEVDILEDGRLDLPDSVLAQLDLVVGAIHYKFNLGRKQQTERIIRAMDNPYFNILAHPSGRLLNRRPPYEVDMARLMQAARERGCFMELNAQPVRLDLTDSDCMLAREHQLKVVISTDAHSTANLDYMRYGISQARRGWLEPADVVNTRGLKALRKLLRRS